MEISNMKSRGKTTMLSTIVKVSTDYDTKRK